jgi:hypothetical protein
VGETVKEVTASVPALLRVALANHLPVRHNLFYKREFVPG